jgi:hypothetical protein
MEWTTINEGGMKILAMDFLNGVLVKIYRTNHEPIFIPGYYVQEKTGDMDGPALRPREKRPQAFGIEFREIGNGDE